MHQRLALLALVTLWAFIEATLPSGLAAQEVWFAPAERGATNSVGQDDYLGLFRRGAAWHEAAKLTNAFVISARFAAFGPEAEVKQVIEGLKRRDIALAVGIGMLSAGRGCGQNVEGYSAPGEPVTIMLRMSRLGADVRYIGMDEPLFYGHFFDGSHACHSPIAAIAHDVADKVRQVLAVYPNLRIGEAEPITSYPGPDWFSATQEWLKAYQKSVGRPLDFFDLDLAWHLDWRSRVTLIRPMLKVQRVALGVIFNGDGNLRSDAAWLGQAFARFVAYDESFGPPGRVIFSSWTAAPSHALPETDPTAFTNILLRYGEWRSISLSNPH